MENLNKMGLDILKTKELADLLNELLSNYSIFYQNTRGYHWNIQGDKFFELHTRYEQLYNELFVKIDEIAERILTLGYIPDHTFSDYIGKSSIAESCEITEDTESVGQILYALNILLTKQRRIHKLSAEINDEGTNAQISNYIREQEKLVWMYSTYLKR